jgi:SAM-dependent methyltransferase
MSAMQPQNNRDSLLPSAAVSAGFRGHWQRLLDDPEFDRKMTLAEVEQAPFVKLLDACLPDGDAPCRVLEVGAGSATACRCLAAHRHGTFFALDIVAESMQVARRAMQRTSQSTVEFVVGDVFQAPFQENSFDLVFSQGLIEHFKDPNPIFEAHVRLVKPGGWLVIRVPQKYSLFTLYKGRRMSRGNWPPGWETEYSIGDLVALGRRHGLTFSHGDGYGSFFQMVVVHLLRSVLSTSSLARLIQVSNGIDHYWGAWARTHLCLEVAVCFRKASAPRSAETAGLTKSTDSRLQAGTFKQ